MKKRLDALNRIVGLQKRMHDLARWRVAALERERETLSGDLEAMFETMERGGLAHGATAAMSERHIRGVTKRIAKLAEERETQRETAAAQGVKAALAGKAAESADARYRAHMERRDLAELIERSIRPRGSSPT